MSKIYVQILSSVSAIVNELISIALWDIICETAEKHSRGSVSGRGEEATTTSGSESLLWNQKRKSPYWTIRGLYHVWSIGALFADMDICFTAGTLYGLFSPTYVGPNR